MVRRMSHLDATIKTESDCKKKRAKNQSSTHVSKSRGDDRRAGKCGWPVMFIRLTKDEHKYRRRASRQQIKRTKGEVMM